MLIELIKDHPIEPIYAADFKLPETDLFNSWLPRTEPKAAVKVNGQLYRFNSMQEKINFTYGLGHFYRETQQEWSHLTLLDKIKAKMKAVGN